MSVEAFADLLERLIFTPGRLAKLALLRRWYAEQPDPDRGVGLAALTGGTPLQTAAIALILLVVMAHGLAWDFMMEPERTGDQPAPG